MDEDLVEELVRLHGEGYRRLITDALGWLETREAKWNLSEQIDRREFIADIVSKTTPLTT